MRRNDEAALLGSLAGILLIASGYTGYRPVSRFFAILEDILGQRPLLLLLAYVFTGIAWFGGFAVLFGSYLIWKDRVRTGRLFVLVGSGAGLLTLILFLVSNLRQEEFSFLASVLPAILGVAIGIAARWRAQAKPIL